MTSLRLISAMVLVYCTIVTANPTSDDWFMKEMNELMEAKEQMDELINDREPVREEYEGEEIETPWVEEEEYSEANDMNELLDSMVLSQTPPPQTCPPAECDEVLIQIITRIRETLTEYFKKIQTKIEEVTKIGTRENPALSCKQILGLNPKAVSGTYFIKGSGGDVEVYCEMGDNVCGEQSGGWMRIADVDMTQSNEQCPSPLKQVSGRKLCETTIGRNGGCSGPSTFETHGIQYSRVCGRITGYQHGSTDAFASPDPSKKGVRGVSINQAYVDGISLTHGNPRKHIFTFASALNDKTTGFTFAQCPCTRTFGQRAPRVPNFVGDNLICNTANLDQNIPKGNTPFLDYDLWSGKGCSSRNQCCSLSGLPWFSRSLDSPTCDDVEMRVCNDEGTTNENVWLEQVELYVQ